MLVVIQSNINLRKINKMPEEIRSRIRTSNLQSKIDFSEVSDQLWPIYGLGRFFATTARKEPTIIQYFDQEYHDDLKKWIPSVMGYATGQLASVGLVGFLISKTF